MSNDPRVQTKVSRRNHERFYMPPPTLMTLSALAESVKCLRSARLPFGALALALGASVCAVNEGFHGTNRFTSGQ
jgi:hypothetical protein